MNKKDWDNVKEVLLFVVWAFTINSDDLAVLNICAYFTLLFSNNFDSVLVRASFAVSISYGILSAIKIYNNSNSNS